MRRLLSALVAFAFAAQAVAAVDPAARGLAVAARSQASANTAAIGALPNLLRPNVLDALGDSWIAQFYIDQGGKLGVTANSIINQINLLYGQRIKYGLNLGASGQRSDEYLARLPALLAGSGGWVWIRGAVNDLAGQGGFNATAAQVWNGYLNTNRGNAQSSIGLKAAYDQVLASGRKLLITSEPGATTFTGTQILERDRFNELQREYAETHANVFYLDINKVLLDPTSATVAFKTGYSGDGTHLITLGANAVAQTADAAQFANLFSPLNALPSTKAEAGQSTGVGVINNNSTFYAATGGTANGGVTGSVPSGYTADCNNGGTVTISSAAGAYGNDITLAMQAPAASVRCQLYYALGTSAFAAGDVYEVNAQASVAAGSVGFLGPVLDDLLTLDGVNYESFSGYTTATFGNGPTTAYTYTLKTKPLLVPAFTTASPHYVYLRMYFGSSCTSGAPCSATVTVRQFAIRRRYAQ